MMHMLSCFGFLGESLEAPKWSQAEMENRISESGKKTMKQLGLGVLLYLLIVLKDLDRDSEHEENNYVIHRRVSVSD